MHKLFSIGHEYMVVYALNKGLLTEMYVRLTGPKEGVDEIREMFKELRKMHNDDWELVAKGLHQLYEAIRTKKTIHVFTCALYKG